MSEPELTIVVEGRTDVELLRTVLGKETAGRVRFFAGQGKMSLASLGRNILAHEGGPLLVVKDADTNNPQLAAEQRGLTRLALSRFAAPEEFDVFVFVPESEVVYFEAPAALRHLLQRDVPTEALRDGLLIPKVTLTKLLAARDGRPAAESDSQLGELLCTGKQAAALREVVQRLLTQHAST